MDSTSYTKMNTPNPVVYGTEAMTSKAVLSEDPPEGSLDLCCPTALSCLLSCACPWVWLFGCRTLNEKEAALVLTWGKFTSVIKKPGLFCFNPCGIEFQVVSVKQKTMDLPGVKLLDLKGNPVVVSGVVFWQINGVRAASLDVENVYQYVHTTALATLKQVVSKYRKCPSSSLPSSLSLSFPMVKDPKQTN